MDLDLYHSNDAGFVDIMDFEEEATGDFADGFAMDEPLDFDSESEELFSASEGAMNADSSQITSLEYTDGNDEELQNESHDANMEDESGDEAEEQEPEAIGPIEDMVLDFLRQLNDAAYGDLTQSDSEGAEKEESSTQLRKRCKVRPKIEIRLADRKKLVGEEGNVATRVIKYPKTVASGSAKPLAQLFNVLDAAHEALISDVPTTKRDVYYKDVILFKSQQVVNQLVDDLAATWDLKRSDLGIRAASKGLVLGSAITIRLFSEEVLTGNDSDGINVPIGEDIQSFGIDDDLGWLLIVEKEAVFQTLCRLGITDNAMMPGRGLMITGKGYPDIATSYLVKSLADALPRSIPVVALVDCDPYGLDILSVYRYGSKAMQHESDMLATRRIKWLGLRASELSSLGIDFDDLLPITKRDEKKILAMIQRPKFPKKWKMELQRSLFLRRKAEIEIISSSTIGMQASVHPLIAYLSEKMTNVVQSLSSCAFRLSGAPY